MGICRGMMGCWVWMRWTDRCGCRCDARRDKEAVGGEAAVSMVPEDVQHEWSSGCTAAVMWTGWMHAPPLDAPWHRSLAARADFPREVFPRFYSPLRSEIGSYGCSECCRLRRYAPLPWMLGFCEGSEGLNRSDYANCYASLRAVDKAWRRDSAFWLVSPRRERGARRLQDESARLTCASRTDVSDAVGCYALCSVAAA